jgi:hypothetical protein
MEGRDVGTADIPGAFMHADMNDLIYMSIRGDMARILVSLDEEKYGPYLHERGKDTVIYVRVSKALYGTLQAALLFWKLLSGKLQSWGFIINPYDRCVANKIIGGSQCTIIWYVDDLKISHREPSVVTELLNKLDNEFGKEAKITINRGRTHEYLGMKFDFNEPRVATITMIDYIKGLLDDAPKEMLGTAITPAGNHLFQVNLMAKKLSRKESDHFHHLVAKLLFLSKRARPDIQTAVAFLSTRVKSPDTDDIKKLGRVIRYLRGTLNVPLRLSADPKVGLQWWVDASFATHHDFRSHTGALLSLGKGAVYACSKRQKINTKSSTEAELVGVDDVMGHIIWIRNFLKMQGYPGGSIRVFQDNQSAMLLENNGKWSSTKRTRHLDIRYFFVTDRIKKKELEVLYCPTEDMVADFFTKPLQGSSFRKHRSSILNETNHCSNSASQCNAELQECVGNMQNRPA